MRRGIVLITLLAACRGGAKDNAAAAGAQVTTAPARLAPFTEVVTAIGTVAPRPGHYAELAAPAPTRVARILVAPGQRVAAGDTLVVFEQAPFEAAAHAADVSLAAAQRAADRAGRLVAAGILPKKDADQAEQDLAAAQTAAITARRNADLAALRSPLAGVVTRLSAVMGGPADPSQPVVAVADPGALDLVFGLSVDAAARVHPGDSLLVLGGEQGTGDTLGPGRVREVGVAVDSASRTVSARAHLPAPRRPLRIGETVFARIAVRTTPRAVVIPEVALVPTGEGYRVFAVDSAGIAHARDVTVGGRSDGLAEITAGLAAGEIVVASGAYGITDSARVTGRP
ncbi:MAG TPA: efflux RND transporter periplasmic adaptor subunit [Gemmatimonadales bacterium]|nr:efflux RND transporter periplasmic adaptor subunit [Gemmatimonadales bacterium]